ncbi:MAG TPA: hypothetical protein VHN81_07035 [Edaphobacter sp.]|nr:hypothetical protein [Edaphobacter sp.]
MSAPAMTDDALIEMLRAKATAPPPEANEIFVRHLKCKESIKLSQVVSQALDRYSGNDSRPLLPPGALLPPLG